LCDSAHLPIVCGAEVSGAEDQERIVENWDEFRTAFQVARMGTVSGAAEVLGVHHATVIRHIDALEKRLGSRLFQRHARGYTPTEAGRDLMAVAKATEEQFSQLVSRIKGQGETVSGELVVTTISGLSDHLTPVFRDFQRLYPDVTIRYLSDMRVFRLDYGEAHVAIRAGSAPQEPDNVVQPFVRLRSALYASRGYVEEYGLPKGPEDYAQHHFVGADNLDSRAPFYRWMRENVPRDRITYRTTEQDAAINAVRSGAGIGFVPVREAAGDADLVEILETRPDWDAPVWLVTHVDLHRTLKVQSFLNHLKAAAQHWTSL
jgi:DNA-binding transcriptional LysR family regulator